MAGFAGSALAFLSEHIRQFPIPIKQQNPGCWARRYLFSNPLLICQIRILLRILGTAATLMRKYSKCREIIDTVSGLLKHGWVFRHGRKHRKIQSAKVTIMLVSKLPIDSRVFYNYWRDVQHANALVKCGTSHGCLCELALQLLYRRISTTLSFILANVRTMSPFSRNSRFGINI